MQMRIILNKLFLFNRTDMLLTGWTSINDFIASSMLHLFLFFLPGGKMHGRRQIEAFFLHSSEQKILYILYTIMKFELKKLV